MNYKYQLEKYSGRSSRYTCPACGKAHRFTRYIDTETGEHLAPHVGRCDREVECGYHYKPKEFFQDNPTPPNSTRHIERSEISPEHMHRATSQHFGGLSRRYAPHNDEQLSATFTDYHNNHLIQYLTNTLGHAATEQLITQYRIGTHHHWRGSTVYWYGSVWRPLSFKML
ncbi:MAG: hypothetical protein H3C54_08345 [Taibaiella sp.]|nr:hypothetical protein [Taibaiella sp.]